MKRLMESLEELAGRDMMLARQDFPAPSAVRLVRSVPARWFDRLRASVAARLERPKPCRQPS